MSNMIVTYNGKTIAEVDGGHTVTLHCKGYVAATDIIARFFVDGSVTYDRKTYSVHTNESVKLHCANCRMMSDVVMYASTSGMPRLSKPVIYLSTDESGVDGGATGDTVAILGRAILGKAILGVTTTLAKLDTPVIRLESADQEDPEEPVVTKLEAPTIRIEIDGPEEPEESVMTKLDTPVIRIETIDQEIPDEPEEPVIVKLGTPTIYIETEEPEEPAMTKLDTPAISLVEETT